MDFLKRLRLSRGVRYLFGKFFYITRQEENESIFHLFYHKLLMQTLKLELMSDQRIFILEEHLKEAVNLVNLSTNSLIVRSVWLGTH